MSLLAFVIQALFFFFLFCVGSLSFDMHRAIAADKNESSSVNTPKRNLNKKRKTPYVRSNIYSQFEKIQAKIEAEEYKEARKQLIALKEKEDLNGNELAQVYNLFAVSHFNAEENLEAIKYWEKVLLQGSDNIRFATEQTTLFTLAQLYFLEEEYGKSVEKLDLWLLADPQMNAGQHVFLAQVFHQHGKIEDAIEHIELALELAAQKNAVLNESWFRLYLALWYEKKDWDKVLNTLQTLALLYPKREYWIQLAAVYAQLERMDEYALIYELADVQGFLEKPQDINNYFSSLMEGEVYYRAALVMHSGIFDQKVVEKNFSNLRYLGQAWQISSEFDRATSTLEIAATFSTDPFMYEKLAQIYMHQDNPKACRVAANRALNFKYENDDLSEDKKTPKPQKKKLNQAKLYYVRGVCEFYLNAFNKALNSFEACINIAKKQSKSDDLRNCRQWIQLSKQEEQRKLLLKQVTSS